MENSSMLYLIQMRQCWRLGVGVQRSDLYRRTFPPKIQNVRSDTKVSERSWKTSFGTFNIAQSAPHNFNASY